MRKGKIIILTTLVLGIFLGMVPMSYCTEGGAESGIGVKVGYLMPSDRLVNDIYGSGLTFGADYLYIFPEKPYGAKFGIDYFSKSKSMVVWGVSIDQSWSVIPVTGSFVYFLTPEKNFYIGVGLGYYSAKETIEIAGISGSASESALGFHCIGGYNFGSFFGEVKISSATVFDDVQVGGISILAGYRFKV